MAKSLAFWLENNNPESSLSPTRSSTAEDIELHFNYWLLNQNQKKELNYFDVGVKFKSHGGLGGDICIYFPFLVDATNYISNLGRVICDSDQLTAAIFNSHIKSRRTQGEAVVFDFNNESDSKLAFYCQIEPGIEKDTVQFSHILDGSKLVGTIVKFPKVLFHPIEEGEGIPNYFRFRVILSANDKENLSQVYKPKDSFYFLRREAMEIVDFRLNEIRNLPSRIRAKLEKKSSISSVHFFLIREAESEHKLSHTDFKRCRVLEKDLWDAYLNTSNNKCVIPKQMLIYHWKEKSEQNPMGNLSCPHIQNLQNSMREIKTCALGQLESNSTCKENEKKYIENFSAFAKFTKTTATARTIVIGITIGLCFGVIAGIGGNYIYSYLPHKAEDSSSSSSSSSKAGEKPFQTEK